MLLLATSSLAESHSEEAEPIVEAGENRVVCQNTVSMLLHFAMMKLSPLHVLYRSAQAVLRGMRIKQSRCVHITRGLVRAVTYCKTPESWSIFDPAAHRQRIRSASRSGIVCHSCPPDSTEAAQL